MEEPPAYLLFVLATTEINKVPDTIVSRCQVFNFKRIGIDEIIDRLIYIADQE
jgi:DNA polymerase-3 subunit gamma/tau